MVKKNFNQLYKEDPLKTNDEIDELQLETLNFFMNNSSTLVGRILSIIINLNDKFSYIIKYLRNACCILEKDVIEIFENLYNQLDKNNLKGIINNLKDISFFCESESESMIWKYRILLINLDSDEENEFNEDYYYEYFKSENINAEEELSMIDYEIKNIDKLNIYWKNDKLEIYKSKLKSLKALIIAYNNRDIHDKNIKKLTDDANNLLKHLDKQSKKSAYSIKTANNLKDEII